MAKFFVWKPEYSVGVKKIDDQHKRLIEIVNDFYTAFTENRNGEKIKEVLNLLIDYTHYHFTAEEQLMVEAKYPDLQEHKKLHNDFVKVVKSFIDDLNNGKSSVTYKLMNFLRNWITEHIKEEDKKYAKNMVLYIEQKKDLKEAN